MTMGPGVSPTGDLMWDQNQTRRKEGALQTGVQFKCLITSKERMGAIPIVNKQLDEVQK